MNGRLYHKRSDGRIYCGDALSISKRFPSEFFHSIITDPPYGLKFMGEGWDHEVPGKIYWREFLRVSKPGVFLLAFGGTRTHHRLMCAIEDGGWKIRDVVMWVYGTGFPKSQDISRAMDKAAGMERKVVGTKGLNGYKAQGSRTCFSFRSDAFEKANQLTIPASLQAQEWDGWGTGLKPAWEPIIVAMKPLDGSFVENAERHGVAGLHIDAGRIGVNGYRPKIEVHPLRDGVEYHSNSFQGRVDGSLQSGKEVGVTSQGRWPANFILSHSPDCKRIGSKLVKGDKRGSTGGVKQHKPPSFYNHKAGVARTPAYGNANGQELVDDWDCVPDCPIRMLDEQGGWLQSGKPSGIRRTKNSFIPGRGEPVTGYGDGGGASRFFYCSKASRSEKGLGNSHPTVKPLALMEYLCRLTETPRGGMVFDPFCGSGTTGLACRNVGRPFVMIDSDEASCRISVDRLEDDGNGRAKGQLSLWDSTGVLQDVRE